MKKHIFSIFALMMSMLFSSCGEQVTSSSSGPHWDVSYYDGSLRILAEYRSSWSFGITTNGDFDIDQRLDPSHYQEDHETIPYYETEGYDELVDRSSETIVFSNDSNTTLGDFSNGLARGILSEENRETLLSILDSNDDIITQSTRNFTDKVLYFDYFYDDFGKDFNYVKTSSFDMRRYDNFIRSGTSASNILYGDDYSIDFTEIEQTFGDAFKVYQIHDETFPKELRYNAQDSRVTTLRDEGTLKAALTTGGGIYAKVWLERHLAEFDDHMNPESENYNEAYSYLYYASKTTAGLVIFFEGHRDSFEDPVDGLYYDMDLDFKVTINNGVVSGITSMQRFTTSIFE